VISAPAFRRFALAFGTAFALIFVAARAKGLALFTVYPSQGIILWGMHRSRDVADPVLDFLPDILVRMDRHRHIRRARDQLYRSALPRPLVSQVLAGMGMGGFGPRNDGVRLPDHSLVPTIGEIFAPIVSGPLPLFLAWPEGGMSAIGESGRVIVEEHFGFRPISDKRQPVLLCCTTTLTVW
jgi:hypothetical protein